MTETPTLSPHPTVRGCCPACGRESLFLGSGGYVTCARIDCPTPDAASTLLEQVGPHACGECGSTLLCAHKTIRPVEVGGLIHGTVFGKDGTAHRVIATTREPRP